MLGQHATSDLVRLKVALAHALQLAVDGSEPGRHVALVALDGVCEYAMFLAALHLGLPVGERASFPDALNKLTGVLRAWRPPGRRGVVQMHSARNQAQHGGALPDPALLPDWAGAAEGFVRSLVHAAFEVELHEVLLASAIDDLELRELIASAELALNADEPPRAFEAAAVAFLAARRRWRDQQRDAYAIMSMFEPFEEAPNFQDGNARSGDYADVGAFAADLGEYHWLIATRRQVADGVLPTHEDARRALQFVYHWILRWQQFDARYPQDRWRQQREELSPPIAGDGETPCVVFVAVAAVERVGADLLRPVVVQVANVPERGRGTWGLDFDSALARAVAAVGPAGARALASTRDLTSGGLTFLFDPALDGEQIGEIVRGTVDEITAQYGERETHAAQRASRAERVAEVFGVLFEAADAELFGAVRGEPFLDRNGEGVGLSVLCLGTPPELAAIAGVLRSRGDVLAGVSWVGDALRLHAFELDEDRCGWFEQALADAVAEVRRTRAFNAEQERERAVVETALRDKLGLDAPTGSGA